MTSAIRLGGMRVWNGLHRTSLESIFRYLTERYAPAQGTLHLSEALSDAQRESISIVPHWNLSELRLHEWRVVAALLEGMANEYPNCIPEWKADWQPLFKADLDALQREVAARIDDLSK